MIDSLGLLLCQRTLCCRQDDAVIAEVLNAEASDAEVLDAQNALPKATESIAEGNIAEFQFDKCVAAYSYTSTTSAFFGVLSRDRYTHDLSGIAGTDRYRKYVP